MTLVEVLAGLALLATLLVGVFITKGRAARQWSVAGERLRAVEAADALLSAWWHGPGELPRFAEGAVPGEAGLWWRTRAVRSQGVEALGAQVVRLEIVARRESQARPLVSVDVVVPVVPVAPALDGAARPGGAP